MRAKASALLLTARLSRMRVSPNYLFGVETVIAVVQPGVKKFVSFFANIFMAFEA
jgi:hypothetical protein